MATMGKTKEQKIKERLDSVVDSLRTLPFIIDDGRVSEYSWTLGFACKAIIEVIRLIDEDYEVK